MKTLIFLTVLFFISSLNAIFSQKIICKKNSLVKKTNPVATKRKPLPKLSRKDSLLNEREFRIEEDEITRDLDLELAKMDYSPKVVVQKNKDALTFYYFKNMSDKEIEMIKKRLENDFMIDSFDIDTNAMNCKVDFKNEASEEVSMLFSGNLVMMESFIINRFIYNF